MGEFIVWALVFALGSLFGLAALAMFSGGGRDK